MSERPRSLLLSLGGAIQTLAWVLAWARPGPIPGPRWSCPDLPCALFYSVSDPSRSRGGGNPGPSWSHPAPQRSLQDRAWTGRTRLLGHFRKCPSASPDILARAPGIITWKVLWVRAPFRKSPFSQGGQGRLLPDPKIIRERQKTHEEKNT